MQQHRLDFEHFKVKVSVLVPSHTISHRGNEDKVMGSAFVFQAPVPGCGGLDTARPPIWNHGHETLCPTAHAPKGCGMWQSGRRPARRRVPCCMAGDWGRLARGGGGNFKFSSKDALIQGHNDGFGVEL